MNHCIPRTQPINDYTYGLSRCCRLLLFILFTCFTFSSFSQINHQQKADPRPTHNTIYINEYSSVISFDPCTNKMLIDSPANFQNGDMVLLIQMQGAAIDSTNTPAFGNIIDYRHTGNYEFNYIANIAGNEVFLQNVVTRKYDFQKGKVQIVNVHPFISYTVADPVSCPAWNGSTGGVIVLFSKNILTLYQPIDATSRGFRQGITANFRFDTLVCGQTDYYADSTSWQYARKGEGIALAGFDKWNGRGKFANGGGGGNAQNSGGGGGGNFGQGGQGGYQLDSCGSAPFSNGGLPGTGLNYNNSVNQIFMGGGGGAGHMDSDNPAFNASGGAGGGIIIIKADSLQSNNYRIAATGNRSAYCYSCTNDGTGGGGAGGTVLLDIGTYLDSATIAVNGGDGSLVLNYFSPKDRVGPGGGGAGGGIWFKGNVPPLARTVVTGGANGTIYDDAENPWGAIPGSNGAVLNNLQMPFDTVAFTQPTILIDTSVFNCRRYTFKGSVIPGFLPIASWRWNFGDGFIDTLQNTVHTYALGASFQVSLTVTDTNSCKTDTVKTIVVPPLPHVIATKSNDIDCFHGAVQLNATGASTYSWQPAGTLDHPDSPNPIASPTQQTIYLVVGSGVNGCTDSNSVTVKTNTLDKINCLMPSAFTPNNDGLNDCFGIKGWGFIQQLNFTIYNRWGQVVFHSQNPGDCWDGKFEGQYQAAGAYVYEIAAKTLCGSVERKGTLVLIR